MMPYGDKFISPEHREAFVQDLMESGESIGVEEDGIVPSDFNVDIGRCLSRAWDTLSTSFWPIVGVTALIMVMIGAASQIPFANLIIVYWRDIPAQVIVKKGRTSAKRELTLRFTEAIDM